MTMMTRKRTNRQQALLPRMLLVVAMSMGGLLLSGCRFQMPAVDPEPGDLKGQWFVNESANLQIGLGSPVLAQLRVENQFEKRVRMVSSVMPRIEEAPDLGWKAYSKLPRVLRPGEVWEGIWLLEEELAPGSYSLASRESTAIGALPARVSVSSEPSPAPVRTQYQCLVARLTGEVEEIVSRLTQEVEAGEAPPSTHLQLAELYLSLSMPELARAQYEIFANKVYGGEDLPAWLQSKMERDPAHDEEP